MGDEDHGRAASLPQRQQIVVEPEAGDLVERGERLVHQQQLRLGHQRARDRDPHPHAAGQFARKGVREIRQADARQRLATRGPRQRLVGMRELERQRTLAATLAQGISVGSWNTKPISAARHCAAIRTVPPADGRAQARDDAQRRRLAAAGRAEQRDEFARSHVEIEAVERNRAAVEGLADAAQRDDGADAAARCHFGRRSRPTPLLTNCSV